MSTFTLGLLVLGIPLAGVALVIEYRARARRVDDFYAELRRQQQTPTPKGSPPV